MKNLSKKYKTKLESYFINQTFLEKLGLRSYKVLQDLSFYHSSCRSEFWEKILEPHLSKVNSFLKQVGRIFNIPELSTLDINSAELEAEILLVQIAQGGLNSKTSIGQNDLHAIPETEMLIGKISNEETQFLP
jgi:hypothetical protein